MISFALAAALLAAQPADCDDARTQSEMNQCADQSYRQADAELNRVWPAALQRVRALDRDLGGGEAERRLREAQRAWIAFRDAHCAVAGLEAIGGSLEPLLVSGCLADLTERRTMELRLLLEER